MATGRLKATQTLVWGKLVKSWATNRNYVDHPDSAADPTPPDDGASPKYPIPKNFADFVTQCKLAKAGLIYENTGMPVEPTDKMGFVAIVGKPDEFVLRLPPKENIDETEAKMKAGQAYVIDPFYKGVFECKSSDSTVTCTLVLNGDLLDTNKKRFDFHAERVGDYTIAGCM